jgi:MoaA/NifB/PqqE/SkfB family radical SAM enzyme
MSLPLLERAHRDAAGGEDADPRAELRPWLGPHGQVMRRLELHVTYTCPERCVFCSEEHRMQRYREYPVTWARVATILRTHASRGVRGLHLTGGEPTIHPRFVEILALAKKLGMRTSVGTIGTMLCREDFARRAVPYLDEALFSLHGPDAATHDAATRRAGSFEQVTAALRLCRELSPRFGAYVNTVVTADNVDRLPETATLADALGAQLVIVSNVTPEGLGLDDYERLAVPLAKLGEVLAKVPARAPGAVIRFFGVPMCVLGEHRYLSNDLHWDPRVTVEWASAPGKVVLDDFYNWTPDRKRVHTPACDGCTHREVCMGVFDRYAELHGDGALRPFTEAVR